MSAVKTIVLFDMDGTLTPPRQPMEQGMLETLDTLKPYTDVGIVSGSSMDYITEQARDFLDAFMMHPEIGNTYIMPCNGTQLYANTSAGYKMVTSNDMKSKLGVKTFNSLIRVISQLQLWAMESSPTLPLTGTFIQYRDSMINWSPSGRDASPYVRNMFVELDNNGEFRKQLRRMLYAAMDMYGVYGVDVTLGGSTSLDIYPEGWDKTYALSHLEEYDQVIFIGDKCMPGGNDHTIFEKLRPQGNAYSVGGPHETIELINNVLVPLLKAQRKH